MRNNAVSNLRQHSLGIMLSVGPLTFFAFLIVAALYYGKNRKKLAVSGEQFNLNMSDAMNKLLLQSLIKQSLRVNMKNGGGFQGDPDEEVNNQSTEDDSDTDLDLDEANTITNNRSGRSGEYSNDRRYSRYEMNEDHEPMSVHEEVLVHDLLQSIEKKSMGCGSSLMSTTAEADSTKPFTTLTSNTTKNNTNGSSAKLPSSSSSIGDGGAGQTTDLQQLNVDNLIDNLNHFYLNESYLQSTKKINIINI
jgi:hypothetical protein